MQVIFADGASLFSVAHDGNTSASDIKKILNSLMHNVPKWSDTL